MEAGKFIISACAVAVVSTVVAISCLAALVAAGEGGALERTALVLAVIAFVADLVIALASYLIASNTEARVAETNAQMQAVIGRIDERTDEVRNLVRLQGKEMLSMIGQQIVESAAPGERAVVERAVREVETQASSNPSEWLTPPGGGRAGRAQRLRDAVSAWVDEKGFPRIKVSGSQSTVVGTQVFKDVDTIYVVRTSTHRQMGEYQIDVQLEKLRTRVADDWPDNDVHAVLVVETPETSGWGGEQMLAVGRIVSVDNLDDILKGEPTPDERPPTWQQLIPPPWAAAPDQQA